MIRFYLLFTIHIKKSIISCCYYYWLNNISISYDQFISCCKMKNTVDLCITQQKKNYFVKKNKYIFIIEKSQQTSFTTRHSRFLRNALKMSFHELLSED